jgi:hypothetical protein
MPFQRFPYLRYMGFILHLHIQTPQFQPNTDIATDYDQHQEIAHTIQNDFTSGDGQEESDGKEDHHPASPPRRFGTKTRKDSAYHVHAIFHFPRIAGCVAYRANP